MTTTRRRFFATLFRSGAAAVALVYAPSLLVTPRVVIRPSRVVVLYRREVEVVMDFHAEAACSPN